MLQSSPRTRPIRTGDVDWPARWRSMVEAREAERPAAFTDGGSRWDGRAERFAFLARSLDPATEPFVVALRAVLRPADTVLDVGAGAGRYALPIAETVARLTAVEPSSGMRAQLTREATERGISNVTLVPGTWQEVEVEPHDVAFVANVLYFVTDAVGFIEKLDRSARRGCFILHRIEERATPLLPLWSDIWGQPRPREVSALDLLNLLFSMGIRASFQVLALPAPSRYTTLDEALPDARQFLELGTDDTTHDARIRAFLPNIMVERDGRWEFPAGPQMAIISWGKLR